MRLSLAVSLLAVFTGHMTEAKGGRGKKGTVQNKLHLVNFKLRTSQSFQNCIEI